ncbi:helix-turn-helix domain-containing protein [Allorhizobium sp. BGMRC 0089]|uniref:transcriptional regulator n=1 Tax=Allorhizobium sonneratiae TaxID=2934936 RepID=UPI0020343691|nr:Cro/CI family transcriptional regulator [Allorhizobium sonneratiae]MCM2292272.1 helix-turn-helix domain-containing protein [Allorhizobium sonneratiae]
MEDVCKQAIIAGGGPTLLAKALGGISPQAISQWRRIPAARVLMVERITRISRHDLRPDIYGPHLIRGSVEDRVSAVCSHLPCGPP